MVPIVPPVCVDMGFKRTFFREYSKLYIPSTLNIDLILWHTQLIVSALSGHLPEIQAGVEVVKIKNPDFSCWA